MPIKIPLLPFAESLLKKYRNHEQCTTADKSKVRIPLNSGICHRFWEKYTLRFSRHKPLLLEYIVSLRLDLSIGTICEFLLIHPTNKNRPRTYNTYFFPISKTG